MMELLLLILLGICGFSILIAVLKACWWLVKILLVIAFFPLILLVTVFTGLAYLVIPIVIGVIVIGLLGSLFGIAL